MRSVPLALRASFFASLFLFVSTSANAVGTRTFDLNAQEDFLGGDLRGVAVDSQGRLRAGWNLGQVTLKDASSVWCAAELADGSVLLGTGRHGKILRYSGGQVTEYADTKQTAVTALAVAKGDVVFAATMAEGRIVRIDGPGKVTELAPIADAENIWGLAYDAKKNGVYAATGPNGKLFFVPANGAPELVFDSDETHLRSVAVADDGTVYAGSVGKALVYEITGPGRAKVLLDAPGDEVIALAIGKNGAIFAAANEMGESPEPPRRSQNAPFSPPVPSSGPRTKVGKGTLLRIEKDGRFEELLARKDTHFTALAVDDAGNPFVGTGAEGRVYTVDENHTSTLMADTDERQVGAIVLKGKTKLVATSDPGVVHEIRGTGGADAMWTSKVLDAGIRAQWGRLFWRSEGRVEMMLRTGNSEKPDATWSEWSKPLEAPNQTGVPPGRFVQIRARFARDANALVREIELPFVTDNERAVVTSIDAKSKAAAAGTSTGPTVPASGGDVPSKSSTVKLSWKTDNPDADPLRYRVQFRFEPQNLWRELTKPDDVLTKAEIDWETASLPEGIYRVRVEASDELANPPDRVTHHALESGPILVDNTPPVFRAIAAHGRKLTAEIVDGIGPIARVDFSIDAKNEWRPLLPKDGVFDEPAEQIDVDLASVLPPGPHLVALRAFDRAGNSVVRDVEVK